MHWEHMLCIPELVTDAYACNGRTSLERRRLPSTPAWRLTFCVTSLCDVGSCRVLGCTSYSIDSKASKSLLVGQLIKVKR